MQFFIDTANISEIREAAQLGIIDGVTTNPTLMSKEGITTKMVNLRITFLFAKKSMDL